MKDILFDVLNKIEPYKIIKLNIGNNEIYVCREDSYFPMAIRFLDYESEMEQTNYFYSYNEEHSLEYVKTHKITLDDTDFLIESEILNVEYYDKYYDSIIIPDCLYRAHPKAAITLKNRWMVENSDLVITYVKRNKGGAYEAMQYAEKKGKRVINICS